MKIEIKGSSSLDADLRVSALSCLNKLPTPVLQRLVTLSENKKAVNYLTTETGFQLIQNFLGN